MSDYKADAAELDILTLDGPVLSAATTPPADETWYSTGGIYFGFQNASVISQYFRESNPVPRITARQYPRGDGQFVEVAQYGPTKISIKGTIQAADRATMEALLDSMKKVCSPMKSPGGTLKLTLAGAARYFDNCTPTAQIGAMYEGRDFYHVIYCPFEISFDCNEPYGRDGSRYAFNGGSQTAAVTFPVTNTGSAPSEFIVTLAIVTAGTLSQFVITNAQTGESMTIATSFSDGDTLEMNGELKTVKKNGTAVDFTGTFVSAPSGDSSVTVTPTGAGYTYGLTGQAYPRYF